MAAKKRVVLIGAGGRANAYTRNLSRDAVEIAGCADPSAANRENFLGLNSLVGLVPQFDDWRAMFDSVPAIDGVIITTPNHLHVEPAVEAMKRGHAVALEKPIAVSAEGCRLLLETKRRCRGRVLVGFGMRSSAFYAQAKKWVDEGRVGQVSSLQADELPFVATTSSLFRSDWRRWRKTSGGSLLEKCCHDLDMITWLAGGPLSLASVAGVKTFLPNPDLPKRCADCGIQKECCYYLPPEIYGKDAVARKANDGRLYKFTRDYSACIYNVGHDIYDHQNVQIEYDNGVIATLTMDFSCNGKMCGRNLKIVGSRGVIFGKFEDNALHLHDKRTDAIEALRFQDDGSGHGGSNQEHAAAFLRMMNDASYEPSASLEAGYLSAMLCFAADESVQQRRQVDVSGLAAEGG